MPAQILMSNIKNTTFLNKAISFFEPILLKTEFEIIQKSLLVKYCQSNLPLSQ